MSNNQLHGKKFEEYIIQALYSNCPIQPNTAIFDVPKEYADGYNVSIKTTKNNKVGLSDARRFWQLNDNVIFIVGAYKQQGIFKEFYEVYEFQYDAQGLNNLRGNLSFDVINDFHDSICKIKSGNHGEGRKFAKIRKKELKSQYQSCIILNPKIDSGNQRRLQCSVSINDLEKFAKKFEKYSVSNKIKLPYIIESSSRALKK